MNRIKFLLSEAIITMDDGYWISRMDLTKTVEPVMRPSLIKGADQVDVVILDAGGSKTVKSESGTESGYALDVVLRAQKLFESQGQKVILTRKDDGDLSVADRLAVAASKTRALFISIQFNKGAESETGVMTEILAPRGIATAGLGPEIFDSLPGNAHDAANIALATAVHAAVVVRTKLYDGGIHHVRTPLLNDIKLPAVILRGGYLTNAHDAGVIADPAYRQALAASLALAVTNYRRAVGAPQKSPTSPPAPK
jgi:N-acetylmuramoyl-L-alanine amidase